MHKTSHSPGLFRRLVRRPVPLEPDAADMGTCFGLELSFDAPAASTPPAAASRLPAWMPRLGLRAKGTP
jgi:hypothetical protein